MAEDADEQRLAIEVEPSLRPSHAQRPAAAEHDGLTLFAVPDATPFLDIIKAVANAQVAQERAAAESMLATQRALTKAATESDGTGIIRRLAAFIPDCVTTVRRLRKDSRVPRRARIAIIIAGIWVASPIDLIPEFIPVIGPLDDIVIVALALRYAGRQVPREVLLAAWPGEPRLIARLLGPTSNDAAV